MSSGSLPTLFGMGDLSHSSPAPLWAIGHSWCAAQGFRSVMGGHHLSLQEGNSPAGEGTCGVIIKPPFNEVLAEWPSLRAFTFLCLISKMGILLPWCPSALSHTVNFRIGLSVHVNKMGPCPLPTLPDPSSRDLENCRLMGGEGQASIPLDPGACLPKSSISP